HVVEELEVLEGAADAELGDLVGDQLVNALSDEADSALVERLITPDEVEERRLAGAVGADQSRDRTGLHREADIPDRAKAAEGPADVLDLQHRRALLDVDARQLDAGRRHDRNGTLRLPSGPAVEP